MTDNHRKFYIDGGWREPISSTLIDVVNPATEDAVAQIAAGGTADVDSAVAAARRAFAGYSMTSREERMALLQRIDDGFKRRREDLAQAMSLEMGVPITAARNVHFPSGPAHLQETIQGPEGLRVRDAARHDDGREGTDRRVRAHHALELPDQPGDVQGRAGAGGRMHDGAQAQRSVAALRADHRGDPSRSGRAGRRVQPGQRRRRDDGSRHGGPCRCRHGVVHRLDARRRRRGEGRRRHREARRPGIGRKVAEHRAAGRGLRPSREPGRGALLQQQRPIVRLADADARAERPHR